MLTTENLSVQFLQSNADELMKASKNNFNGLYESSEEIQKQSSLIAHQANLRAFSRLSESGASKIIELQSISEPKAQKRSLNALFGNLADEYLFSNVDLMKQIPSRITHFINIWQFPDFSYILQISSSNDDLGNFVNKCLEDESFVELLHLSYQQSHGGKEMSYPHFLFLKNSFSGRQESCIPLDKNDLFLFFQRESKNDEEWKDGYHLQSANGLLTIKPYLLSKMIESFQGGQ